MHHIKYFVVDQGATAKCVDFIVTVLGKLSGHRVLKIIGALFGDHVDRAGKGCPTKECCLRALDDFHSLNDIEG